MAARQLGLKIFMYGLAGAILLAAAGLVVSAALLWLQYADPDPALREEFGRELAAAVVRDPALADFDAALDGDWTHLSILGPRLTPAEITACLGHDWANAGPASDILGGDTALAIVLSRAGAVARVSWGQALGERLTVAGAVCALARPNARFPVEARRVAPGPGDDWDAFDVHHLGAPVPAGHD